MFAPAVRSTIVPRYQAQRAYAADAGDGTLTPDRNTRIPLQQAQIPRRISGAGSEFPDFPGPFDSPDDGSLTAQDRPRVGSREVAKSRREPQNAVPEHKQGILQLSHRFGRAKLGW